jgi:ABC-type sugar transport system ATPase subunit
VATIFVSHRLNEIFELSDAFTVLRDGHTAGSGRMAEIDRERLIELMTGRVLEHVVAVHSDVDSTEAPALRVRGLTLPGAFEDVSLDVHAGEIVGLAGLVGAGRSELLESLFGLRHASGQVELAGRPATHRSPRRAVRDRLAFVPADRKLQGLVLQMSVRENLMMAATCRTARIRPPSARRELAAVRTAIDDLHIRAHSPRVPVSTLSGGNQQKVVLGKWLATEPRVLMLDEPTRGVDVGAKAEIYRLLFDAAKDDIAVLISSSEIPELLTLCDRVVVMFRGRVVASLEREQVTEARIAHFAGGHA